MQVFHNSGDMWTDIFYKEEDVSGLNFELPYEEVKAIN